MNLDELKTQFDLDGFTIVRGLLDDSVLTEIRARIATAVQRLGLEKQNKSGAESKEEERARASYSRFQLYNVNKGLERIDPYFRAFLETGSHIEILEHLLGESPRPATASYFSKDEPDEVIHPHRDGDNGATIWIALDPCGPENGCLYFLRGSHRDDNPEMWDLGEVDELMSHPDAVPAELKPGDASIHFSKTIHWSGRNKSRKPRRGLNAFYQEIDRHRRRQLGNSR